VTPWRRAGAQILLNWPKTLTVSLGPQVIEGVRDAVHAERAQPVREQRPPGFYGVVAVAVAAVAAVYCYKQAAARSAQAAERAEQMSEAKLRLLKPTRLYTSRSSAGRP